LLTALKGFLFYGRLVWRVLLKVHTDYRWCFYCGDVN